MTRHKKYSSRVFSPSLTSLAILLGLTLLATKSATNANNPPPIKNVEARNVNTTSFLETFDGTPSSPEPFTQTGQNTWDIAVHSRNSDTWDNMVGYELHHGPNCEPPLINSATVPFTQDELVTHSWDGTYEQAVYKCANHIMTAVNGIGRSVNDGYALAVLTPNHMVDFSGSEATIKFNISTYRTTQRDWIDVWITPYEDNLQLPFATDVVDLQGFPMNTVQVEMFPPNDNSQSAFAPHIIINGNDTGEFEQFTNDYNWYTGYEDYLAGGAGSPKERNTFEIKISKNHVSICMPNDNTDNSPSQTICWADKDISTLPFDKGIVQFAHHSYTPNKDCNFYEPLICGPNTWHWDDISISPSIPFTMIKADKRMVRNENTTVNFNQPAPTNAKLRFSAAGAVSLSFDGGSFTSVTRQPATQPTNGHAASYFVDIPEGARQVKFRLEDNGVGEVHAKDFAIWSMQTSDNSSSTNTPTPVQEIIPGDANQDGEIDHSDFRSFINDYGLQTLLGSQKGDFNANGRVDIFDYAILYKTMEYRLYRFLYSTVSLASLFVSNTLLV